LRRTRRQILVRTFEVLGSVLLLADVVIYFAAWRPMQTMAIAQHEQFNAARRRIFDDQEHIERLEKFKSLLPGAGQGLETVIRDHMPARRQAFSQAAKLVRRVTGQSGTELSSVAYKLDLKSTGPVERMGLAIGVLGPFPGLMKVAHALETASDFLVIRGFTIEPGENNMLNMRLDVDMYMTP
jgi:hypothetical protein